MWTVQLSRLSMRYRTWNYEATHCTYTLHESSVGLTSTTNPKPRRNPPNVFSGKPMSIQHTHTHTQLATTVLTHTSLWRSAPALSVFPPKSGLYDMQDQQVGWAEGGYMIVLLYQTVAELERKHTAKHQCQSQLFITINCESLGKWMI